MRRTMGLLLCLVALARAADMELKATQVASGRMPHEAEKAKPAGGYVAGPKALAKLWKEWKIKGKPPVIDFKKEIVLVGTTGGSGMGLSATLTDKGDLRVDIIATADVAADSGFQIVKVPVKDVKTIGGKAIKLEKAEEP